MCIKKKVSQRFGKALVSVHALTAGADRLHNAWRISLQIWFAFSTINHRVCLSRTRLVQYVL